MTYMTANMSSIHVTEAILCLSMVSFAVSFSSVVTDAMLVIQSQKDPDNGSQNLVSFQWMAHLLGQIVGSIAGGCLVADSSL